MTSEFIQSLYDNVFSTLPRCYRTTHHVEDRPYNRDPDGNEDHAITVIQHDSIMIRAYYHHRMLMIGILLLNGNVLELNCAGKDGSFPMNQNVKKWDIHDPNFDPQEILKVCQDQYYLNACQ